VQVKAQVNDEPPAPPSKRRKKKDSSKSAVAIPVLPEELPADQDGTNRESGGDLERRESSDIEGELEIDMYADHPTRIFLASLITATAQSQKMSHYLRLQRKGFLHFRPRKAPS